MRNSTSEDKDYALHSLLLLAARTALKAREKELNQYGLTPEQAGVLFIIHFTDNSPTPAEISRRTIREPHSVSGLISRMEKRGLVRKVKDPNRKNLVRVALTEKGLQAYHRSTGREPIHRIMSCLSEKERQQLRSLLEKILDKALEQLGIDRRLPFP